MSISKTQYILFGLMGFAPAIGGVVIALAIACGIELDNGTIRGAYFVYLCAWLVLCALLTATPLEPTRRLLVCVISLAIMAAQVVFSWFLWAIVGFVKYRGFEGIQ